MAPVPKKRNCGGRVSVSGGVKDGQAGFSHRCVLTRGGGNGGRQVGATVQSSEERSHLEMK